MTTATLLQDLASYVPHLVVRQIAADPTPPTQAAGERFDTAVFFADISGFTVLTERLTRRGTEGVEDLSHLLNAYFGQLIDIVLDGGGDIVEFTGDGIIALWPIAPQEPLAQAVLRASDCALRVQERLAVYALSDDLRLSLRISVGAGEVLFARVGGVLNHWELLVAGDPLVQVSIVEHYVAPGDVVISPEAWQLVGPACRGEPLEAGGVRLLAVEAELSPRRRTPTLLLPQMAGALRVFLPGLMLDRLEAGLTDWLAELRHVTIIFLNVRGLDYAAPDAVECAQAAMRALQMALYQHEGSMNQFVVDDKGTTLVAAMGLPPLSHEDDAVRAVQAALAMHARLRGLGVQSSIGITSGRVFCGSRGNVRRRDYAMIGDSMNLAARLMQAAANLAPDGEQEQVLPILCDAATYEATRGRLVFDVLPPVQVKGKTEPVPIYRPLGRMLATIRRRTMMVGRAAERALLRERLDMLARRETPGVVIIEGETGVGKSRLINDLLHHADERGVISLLGAGDPIERTSSYHAWRPIFSDIFDLDTMPNDQLIRRVRVLTRLWVEPELARLAPLINAVLPLDIPENAITAQMVGQVRADNTRRLLLYILELADVDAPVLLVFDEAHWMDSASWALVLEVMRRDYPLMVVVAMRSQNGTPPAEYDQLVRLPDTCRILLDSLGADEAIQLACQALGVTSLPEPVARLIVEKSEGNPFFVEELTYALRDAGVITISDGTCAIAAGTSDLSSINFPTSMQGVIISRLDRLIPAQQLALKVASVIGHTFSFRTLQAVYPLEQDRPLLGDYLQALERLHLVAQEAPEPSLTYSFKHIILQEVVYNLLLFAQRRGLHRAVAEWYEAQHADDLPHFYALLAHHWLKAADPARAIDYLELAGEQAICSYANHEAAEFFRRILALVDGPAEGAAANFARGSTGGPEAQWADRVADKAASVPVAAGPAESNRAAELVEVDLEASLLLPDPDALRRAHWERRLGEAYLGLGKLTESRQHLECAVLLLRRPVPSRHRRLMTMNTIRQVLRQTLHRLWFRRLAPDTPAERSVMLEAVRAYESLAVLYYFANETFPALYTSLLMLNLAERAGPSAELARTYATMAIATGSLGLHPLAEAYSRQAHATVGQVTDMPTHAYVLNVTGLYHIGVGHWHMARLAIEQAVDMYDQLGDQSRWGASWTLLAQIAYYEGDFARSDEMFAQLAGTAQGSDDLLKQAWAQGGRGQSALRMGRLDEAGSLLETALSALDSNAELPSRISNYGLLAIARLRQGNGVAAHRAAEAAAELMQAIRVPTVYYLFEGYAGFAEVALALWEASRGQPPAQRRAQARQAEQACAALAHYTRTFPIGRPRTALCRGLALWLGGRLAPAHAAWRAGLAAAEALTMPYETGLLHYEIGRHTTGAERCQSLERAHAIFARLGAAGDVARVQALLA